MMTIENFFDRKNENWNFCFDNLTEVEQNELKAEILQDARAFRKILSDFVETLDCKYTELANKITEFANTFSDLSFWVEDDGTALGADGWLDIYSDLFAVVINVDKDGKFFVNKELEIEIDFDGNGADFAFVDTESGEFTNI